MQVSTLFSPRLLAVLPLIIVLCPGALEAQTQNPLQSFKDALNKAKQQAKQPDALPATQPAAQPAAQVPAQKPALATQQAAAITKPGSQPAPANQLAVPGAFTSSLLTPAPLGGLDPSKLPDLLGVHIGEPPDQVIAELQKLYPIVRSPGGAVQTEILSAPHNRYPFPNAPLYTATVYNVRQNPAGCSPATCESEDRIDAIFSGPPEKRVVQLVRNLSWRMGKTPTSDTLKTALIQKYGTNFAEGPALTLTWLFDESGNPMPPLPRSVALTGCQRIVSNQNGVGGGLPSYLGIGAPQRELQQDLDRIVKVRCGMQVQVVAWINGTPGGTANSLQVTISEIAEDLRAAFAAENYIWQGRNADSNQQLKNAQQQATPTF